MLLNSGLITSIAIDLNLIWLRCEGVLCSNRDPKYPVEEQHSMDSNISQYLILTLNAVAFTVQWHSYPLQNQVLKKTMYISTVSIIGHFFSEIKSGLPLFNESALIFSYYSS